MRQLRKHWEHWWLRECEPHALAVVRISLGCFLFFYLLRYVPHIPLVFSNMGIAMPLHAEKLPDALQFLVQPSSPACSYILFGLLLLSTVLIALGYTMRLGCILFLLISAYFWQSVLHPYPASVHRIFFVSIAALSISGADKTYSLRMLLSHKSISAWEPISILPQRIIALQITATYLGAGWQKVYLPMWDGGEVLTYSMLSSYSSGLGFALVRMQFPMAFYDGLVLAVTLFECMLPFGLWMRGYRKFFMIGGVAFHVSIALLLYICSFLSLIIFYVLFFEPQNVYCTLESYKQNCVRFAARRKEHQ